MTNQSGLGKEERGFGAACLPLWAAAAKVKSPPSPKAWAKAWPTPSLCCFWDASKDLDPPRFQSPRKPLGWHRVAWRGWGWPKGCCWWATQERGGWGVYPGPVGEERKVMVMSSGSWPLATEDNTDSQDPVPLKLEAWFTTSSHASSGSSDSLNGEPQWTQQRRSRAFEASFPKTSPAVCLSEWPRLRSAKLFE